MLIRTNDAAFRAFVNFTGLYYRKVPMTEMVAGELLRVEPLPRPAGLVFTQSFRFKRVKDGTEFS